jgi:hypothetical protein
VTAKETHEKVEFKGKYFFLTQSIALVMIWIEFFLIIISLAIHCPKRGACIGLVPPMQRDTIGVASF